MAEIKTKLSDQELSRRKKMEDLQLFNKKEFVDSLF